MSDFSSRPAKGAWCVTPLPEPRPIGLMPTTRQLMAFVLRAGLDASLVRSIGVEGIGNPGEWVARLSACTSISLPALLWLLDRRAPIRAGKATPMPRLRPAGRHPRLSPKPLRGLAGSIRAGVGA